MLFVGGSSDESPLLSVDQLDQVIFDRVQLQDICQDDLILLKTEISVDCIEETLVTDPVAYIVACFKRAAALKKSSDVSFLFTVYQMGVESYIFLMTLRLLNLLKVDDYADWLLGF